jgi:hypothetical protein
MRFGVILAILCAVAMPAATPAARAVEPMTADYVEARTASVFAGACHYNGEVVTTGREAVLAWHVRKGSWKGIDLTGCRVVAVVRSDRMLDDAAGRRVSEIVVDAPTEATAAAIVDAWRAEYAAALGEVATVRRGSIAFDRTSDAIRVDAPGFATVSMEAMPNAECCKMPNLVWYKPLVPVADRKVGYTHRASYAGGAAGSRWERADENSAFYGTATLGSR